MKLYSIKDTKVGFGKPFQAVNNAVAVRDFSGVINSPGYVQDNYTDFELFAVGEFNENTGEFFGSVEYLVKGSDVRKVDE